MSPERTLTLSRRPSVSTRMWRLRPVTFLPASYPADRARSPLLSGLGALAVDDRRSRARLASRSFARHHVERVVDAIKRAVPIPQHEIEMRGALGRQILRQGLPLAAGRQHVEDFVEDFANINRATSPPTPRWWN